MQKKRRKVIEDEKKELKKDEKNRVLDGEKKEAALFVQLMESS